MTHNHDCLFDDFIKAEGVQMNIPTPTLRTIIAYANVRFRFCSMYEEKGGFQRLTLEYCILWHLPQIPREKVAAIVTLHLYCFRGLEPLPYQL